MAAQQLACSRTLTRSELCCSSLSDFLRHLKTTRCHSRPVDSAWKAATSRLYSVRRARLSSRLTVAPVSAENNTRDLLSSRTGGRPMKTRGASPARSEPRRYVPVSCAKSRSAHFRFITAFSDTVYETVRRHTTNRGAQ